jgi:hypothetical protein
MTLDLPQLRYPGDWQPRPGALRELGIELQLRTRIEPVERLSTPTVDAAELFDTPLLYVAGQGAFPELGRAADGTFARFVDLGGLIVFDAADGGADAGFTRDVQALVLRAFGASLAPVDAQHVLFRSFYILSQPAGRTLAHDRVLGLEEDGRLKILLLRNDLGGALARTPEGLWAHPCVPGGPDQREHAFRLAVNIVLYATCTDYKADPAHVQTLLRARHWRADP